MRIDIEYKYNRKKNNIIEVQLYISKMRKRIWFSTGVKCSESDWLEKVIIRPKATDSELKNTIIQSYKKRITEFY